MSNAVIFKYECGDRVKDRVTDFVGIIEARMECLNGCLRYAVTGRASKDGEVKGYHIDEGQRALVDRGINKTKPVNKNKTGAPMTRAR